MPLPGLDDRMTLSEASLALGVHPFDLIRVLVALGAFPPDLHLNAASTTSSVASTPTPRPSPAPCFMPSCKRVTCARSTRPRG